MKARLDLEPKDIEVLNNPYNYYIDSQGRVNELEDDEERMLFGTIAEGRQVEHEIRLACEAYKNPHLLAIDAMVDILEKNK